MNELYFSVKGSAWKAKNPTAYYMDNVCEFLVCHKKYGEREGFLQNFVRSLMKICRVKYDSIINNDSAEVEEDFILEIPNEISGQAKHAFLWYLKNYPEGDFIETVKDFLEAIGRTEEMDSSVIIRGK
jgi:hypothetical protein